MAAARCIGVRKLIDENDLRPPRDDGVEVHLLEALAFVLEAPAGHDFEALQQRFGLFASVGLHDADDNVVAVLLSGPGLLQHFIGFADARRGTHEDLQLAEASLFAPGRLEQGIRRRALVWLTPLICHAASVLARDLGPARASRRAGSIQSKVQRKHINARLAEETEGTTLDMLGDELREAHSPACYAPSQCAGPGNRRPQA